jgi:hypothetical protein
MLTRSCTNFTEILAHIHVGDCPIRTVIHLITYSFLLAILAACHGFSYAQLFEVWRGCSFCWYWWNCYSRSLVLCVYFVDRCLSVCTVSFGHCVVCSSSIYGFWLPLWYLQTLLDHFRLSFLLICFIIIIIIILFVYDYSLLYYIFQIFTPACSVGFRTVFRFDCSVTACQEPVVSAIFMTRTCLPGTDVVDYTQD